MNGSSPYTGSDVMTRAVVAVRRDTPVQDIVRLIEEWRAGALPVLEGEGRVVGVDGTVAAFETDGLPAETRSGWSVIVTGRATVVTGPAGHERPARTGPASWMPLRETVFARIGAETVTGRELRGATAGR